MHKAELCGRCREHPASVRFGSVLRPSSPVGRWWPLCVTCWTFVELRLSDKERRVTVVEALLRPAPSAESR